MIFLIEKSQCILNIYEINRCFLKIQILEFRVGYCKRYSQISELTWPPYLQFDLFHSCFHFLFRPPSFYFQYSFHQEYIEWVESTFFELNFECRVVYFWVRLELKLSVEWINFEIIRVKVKLKVNKICDFLKKWVKLELKTRVNSSELTEKKSHHCSKTWSNNFIWILYKLWLFFRKITTHF